ncbi:MAG TPA: FtsX-like permease family protein [Gemmatimonadaceae bacterium]|nr:FtsX-like permease family protein [Gemmatimonadaceae bacterium]
MKTPKLPAWRRYRELLGPNPERDLRDELRFHLETETEELIAAGVAPEEARRQALARFGDVDGAIAQCRDSDRRRMSRRHRGFFFDALEQDVRYAARTLRKQPAFAATVVLVLALGIGANAAVFSVVDPLFFRMPAGVRAPRQVKQLYVERRPARGEPYYQMRFSLPEARFVDSSLAAGGVPSAIWFRNDANVDVAEGSANGTARRAKTQWVTPRFFTVLGVRPFAGSDFAGDDGRFGVPASSAIVSWQFWQRTLGGDPGALGRVIRVAGRPVTIRGIAPRGFGGIDLDAADLWLPLGGFAGFGGGHADAKWYESWGMLAFRMVARAPAAAGGEQRLVARAEAGERAAAAFIAANPRPGGRSAPLIRVVPGSLLLARGPDGMTQEDTIAALLGALAVLLLVMATANVGNLLLGRAVTREREIAVRVALGVTRRRLASLLIIESVMLALAATAAAVLVAAWMGAALRALLLPGVQMTAGPLDGRVGALALGLGLAVGLFAALVPLASALRPNVSTMLKSTTRDGGGGRGQSRARMTLVGVQAALSVMLLIGTGLVARSLYNVRSIDLGLDVDRVITVTRPDSARGPTLEEVASAARGLPGVTTVALSANVPLDDQFGAHAFFDRNGDSVRVPGLNIGFVAAEPGYLDVVGTRVVRGRGLTAADRFGAAPVMVVSEELARRVWTERGQGDAIGQCLRIELANSPCYTVVGIAENAHSFDVVEQPRAVFYIPFDQRPDRTDAARSLVVRTSRGTRAIAERLRAIVGDTIAPANAADPIAARRRQVVVMADMLAWDYRPWELGARLFGAFAGLALLLALFGLYGVLSYVVALRRREIGVRMALGADRRRVMSLIVGEGVRQVTIGTIVGVAIAVSLAGRISALLYHVSPRDPAVVAAAVVLLVACAALAAAIPGRRAMGIDPMMAIREE